MKNTVDLSTKKFLLIAGMHRSNTSYIANVIQNTGLFMGDKLIAGNEHNKKGHFEDQDIVEFHESLLHNYDLTSKWNYVNVEKLNSFDPSPEVIKQAEQLLISKTKSQHQFCWKDPRNCHFLNLWQKVVPQTKYLFIIRHPQETVRSLIRRSLQHNTLKFRPDLYYRLHKFWRITNQQILDFYLKNKSSSILMMTPEFINDKSFENRVNRQLIENWQFDIKPLDLASVYDEKLVTSKYTPPSPISTPSIKLYNELHKLAKG